MQAESIVSEPGLGLQLGDNTLRQSDPGLLENDVKVPKTKRKKQKNKFKEKVFPTDSLQVASQSPDGR